MPKNRVTWPIPPPPSGISKSQVKVLGPVITKPFIEAFRLVWFSFSTKESFLYIYEGLPNITKPNLFGYWLIQSYLPSYWLMLCQLLPVSGIQAFKDISKPTKYKVSLCIHNPHPVSHLVRKDIYLLVTGLDQHIKIFLGSCFLRLSTLLETV